MNINNKLKYLIVAVTFVMLPTIVQAAWWNPFTWFENTPEEQAMSEIPDSTPSQENEEIREEKQNNSEIEQLIMENTAPKVEVTEPKGQTIPTATNQMVNNTEINNLKTEIQSLKTSISSIQAQAANTTAVANNEPSDNSAVYEQILNKLNALEQKVENLENQVEDNNYSKLLARVEALEKSTPSENEDQSGVIKAIIDRVNLLTNNAGIVDVYPSGAGDEYWVPLVCDPGNPTADIRRRFYDNKLLCKNLTDLKY